MIFCDEHWLVIRLKSIKKRFNAKKVKKAKCHSTVIIIYLEAVLNHMKLSSENTKMMNYWRKGRN